jgi:putative ABC transport system permease protein
MSDKHDRELNDELESHLRMAAQDKQERGTSRSDAEAAARRELGNAGLISEVIREQDGWQWWERLMQDVRFGFRMLRKNPGFTAVSIMTLALGIGASSAIFSVVYGVLLRPLPYEKANQIVRLWEKSSTGHNMSASDPNFEDFRSQNSTLQGLAEFGASTQSISGPKDARRLTMASVSKDFFQVMRVQPIRGRTFLPEEQKLGAAPAALVSYAYWRDSLGMRDDLTGVRLRAGEYMASVVGVLPPGFRYPDEADMWVPRELFEFVPGRDAHNWKVVGRLKDGVSLAVANAEFTAIAQRIKQQNNGLELAGVSLMTLQDSLTGEVSTAMLILLGAVGFLLLVACANVMNLLLAQAASREGELATRAALGASRSRLVRQFLVESFLLCMGGGILGMVTARFGVKMMVAIAPNNIPRLDEVSVNVPVMLFALSLCCCVAAALGIVTALRATSGNIQATLMEGNRRQAAGRNRMGQSIIAMQLGITMVLLIGAGLLGRSFMRVLSVDPGFRTDRIVAIDMALSPVDTQVATTHRVQFLDTLLARLRVLPGVASVGGTGQLPLNGDWPSNGTFVELGEQDLSPGDKAIIQRTTQMLNDDMKPDDLKVIVAFFGRLFKDQSRTGDADYAAVSSGYFETLGIQLLRGRFIDDRDGPSAPHVAVISESMAKQRWPSEDPIGHTIEFGNMDGDLRLLRIVGVIADVKQRNLERQSRPTIYVSYRQRPHGTSHFTAVVKTAMDPASIQMAARKVVADLDPNVPPRIKMFQQVVDASLTTRRFNLSLIAIFAGSALALAMIGIYGVLAYSVASRTREMGVRIALGATPGNVRRLVLKQALLTALLGVGLGVLAAFGLTRLLQSMLFGVKPTDPVTFALVTLILLAVALLAAYVPARRATKVDPIIALRYE